MATKVYEPKVQLTLYKTIKRANLVDGVPVSERFSGTGSRVDLSPYVGEGSSINVRKSVREPAGAFSLTLLDRPFIGYVDVPLDQLPPGQTQVQGAESIYGIIEPMDVIEIRMRHGGIAESGDPPVVMRGFVSTVGRGEGVGQDGRPIRTVQVQGQDFGKIWQMLQILYLPGYVIGQDTISAFRLFERFGIGLQTSMKASDFISQVLTSILSVFLERMMPADSPMVKAITLDADQLIKHGTTSITGPQNQEGTVYDLIKRYCDVGIWNELFLEDREDGVYLVCRPNPFKDVFGNAIVGDAPLPESIELPAIDVQSINVARSDAGVANYYWVSSPRFELVTDIYRKQFAVTGAEKDTVLLGQHANSSESLYGIRMMRVDTEMGGDDLTTANSGLAEADNHTRDTSQVNWISYRRKLLVDMNKDNVLFESGSIRSRGNEAMRAGVYAKLTRGQFVAEYYIVEHVHDWIWGQSFTTSLKVERGTGFIARAQRNAGKDSPYYAEMAS